MGDKYIWYKEWFNTPYYHKLYDHRNDKEAEEFMINLIEFLDLPKDKTILDLPCGRGRHSIFLKQLGYNVQGADLSENSISFAKKLSKNSIDFFVHDMKKPLYRKYDAIFNLFTSFGYFECDDDNITILKNFKNALNENGIIVLDFLNAKKVENELVENEVISKNEVIFNINRSLNNEHFIKEIQIENSGETLLFQEKVQYLTLEKFQSFAKKADLKIKNIFGNYNLEVFDANNSDRLIIIFE